MAVNLQVTPITNTCGFRVALMNGGVIVATLDPGAVAVLTLAFNQTGSFNPGLPPIFRNQNPPAVVNVVPGNVAWIAPGGGGLQLQFGPPGGMQQAVTFL
jgi:hypothetical protein